MTNILTNSGLMIIYQKSSHNAAQLCRQNGKMHFCKFKFNQCAPVLLTSTRHYQFEFLNVKSFLVLPFFDKMTPFCDSTLMLRFCIHRICGIALYGLRNMNMMFQNGVWDHEWNANKKEKWFQKSPRLFEGLYWLRYLYLGIAVCML